MNQFKRKKKEWTEKRWQEKKKKTLSTAEIKIKV